jgi:hypothetical protein
LNIEARPLLPRTLSVAFNPGGYRHGILRNRGGTSVLVNQTIRRGRERVNRKNAFHLPN